MKKITKLFLSVPLLFGIAFFMTGNVFALHCDAHFTYHAGSAVNSIAFTSPPNTSSTLYFWTFGDGTSSTQANPTHAFANAGTYLVCLKVKDSTNLATPCVSTFCDSVKIGSVSNTATCNARFKYLFSNTAFNNVSFTAAINPPGTRFSWNFGDGTTSSLANPTHAFANSGVYWVCLTVSDTSASVHCKSTWCDSVRIKIPPPPPVCNAHFTIKPGTTINGVGFAPAANLTGAHYFWDFGDGTTSNQANPYHTFQHSGTYWVCLEVIDSTLNGTCHDKWCDSVRIGYLPPPPPANTTVCNAQFKYSRVSAANLLWTNQFTSAVNPPGTVYSWDFGDGHFSSSPNPLHTYTSGGPYNVCLTVSLNTSTITCKNRWCNSVYPRAASVPGAADGSVSIVVYPNPMSDYATVTLANTVNLVTFSIYDEMGRMVYQKNNLSDGSFEIGTDLSPGLYFYRANDESEVIATGKLIVQ